MHTQDWGATYLVKNGKYKSWVSTYYPRVTQVSHSEEQGKSQGTEDVVVCAFGAQVQPSGLSPDTRISAWHLSDFVLQFQRLSVNI